MTPTCRRRRGLQLCVGETADAIVEENATARIDGLRTALAVLAIFALIALFFSGRIPTEQPAAAKEAAAPTTEPHAPAAAPT